MYPRQHALVSASAVSIVGLYLGLEPVQFISWVLLGTAAGVFIDADHLPLAIIFNGRLEESLYWIRHPLEAVMNGKAVEEDIDPEGTFIGYRLASHIVIFLISVALYRINPLFLPIVVGIGAHVLADIYWDFRTQEGFPYL